MNDATWYYAREGQQQGPMTAEALRSALANSRVRATDLVWREGMPDWVPANSVPELASAVAARSGGPPPLPARPLSYYAPPPPSGDDIAQNAGMRMLMPVGRSGWAIAAGYLGLFSVLIIPAPVALVCSLMAIRDMRRHPELHGMGRAVFGLIMGGLGSIGIVGAIIAAIAHA
jgi:hypothetical protein